LGAKKVLCADTAAVNSMQIQLIVDKTHGQYLLYQNSWHNERRHYGRFLHIEVGKDGKIWLQHDALRWPFYKLRVKYTDQNYYGISSW
jgi:XisI protein